MLTRKASKYSSAPERHKRQDGIATRQQVLEVAGEVFARRGYAHATSKEICERAKTNAAAVNYHFGSKDGLYGAVLIEAHSRLVSLEDLLKLAESGLDARAKLEGIIGRLVGEVSRKNAKSTWEFRVLSRELLSPGPMFAVMLKNQAAPKARILRTVIAEIMELPFDHPAVGRSIVNVIAPCILLVIANQSIKKQVLPDLETDPAVLTQHMMTYALAGLQAVAKEARSKA